MSDIPDYFHALIGYRRFDVRDRGTLLVSANYPQPWPGVDPGPAVCINEQRFMQVSLDSGTYTIADLHEEHEGCPALKCSCGYYCYKDRADVQQHAQGTIVAKVEVWGRIAQHTRGYRAERMKLVEIYVPDAYTPVAIAGLTARYGIPVTIKQEIYSWTSDSPNGSSSANPSQNLSPSQLQALIQSQTFQAQYNQQFQNYQNVYQSYGPYTPPSYVVNSSGVLTQVNLSILRFVLDAARGLIYASDGSYYSISAIVATGMPADVHAWYQTQLSKTASYPVGSSYVVTSSIQSAQPLAAATGVPRPSGVTVLRPVPYKGPTVSFASGPVSFTCSWIEESYTDDPPVPAAKPAPRQYFNFYED